MHSTFIVVQESCYFVSYNLLNGTYEKECVGDLVLSGMHHSKFRLVV